MISNYIYDLVKIKYIREGYLPDLPYHLVSNNEMYEAFLSYDTETDTYKGYFTEIYPAPTDSVLLGYYNLLIRAIYRHLCIARGLETHSLKEYGTDNTIVITDPYLVSSGMVKPITTNKPISATNYTFLGLPNWVYAYMLGNVISDRSDDEMDYEDLLTTFNVKNFVDMQYDCYKVSKGWLQKLPDTLIYYNTELIRPASIFGEPHIIKAIRLDEASRGA
jgi:hypothetical protein